VSRTLHLSPAAWSPAAEVELTKALRRSSLSVAELRQACESGRMRLWCVSADAEHAVAGYYVTWVDSKAAGDELVIVAAAGRLPGIPLTRAVLPAIEALAAGAGCNSVRVHSIRPGMLKALARQGYAPAEIVYRKAIA
jgi:hypothetical protein